jgi:hypothetical protein
VLLKAHTQASAMVIMSYHVPLLLKAERTKSTLGPRYAENKRVAT